MSNKAKSTQGVQPKLRFPEFRDAGDWNEKKLGSVVMAETSSLALGKQELLRSGYPIYGASGLAGFISSYEQDQDYIAIVKDGSGVGNLFYCKKESSILGTLNYLKSRDTDAYPLSWVYFLLQTINFSKYKKGSGIPHIYYSDYAHELIATATPEELQRIADCLSSLDELIEAEDAKLEALQQHKKGLMQELFPAEGETLPSRRFPEFKNAPEWEEAIFAELKLDVSDGNYSAKYPTQSDFLKSGVPFLRANNLKNGTVVDDDMRFISKEQHAELKKGHLKEGDVLISTRGELGNVAIVPAKHVGSNINAQLVRINTKNKVNNIYLFQLFDLYKRQGIFEAISTGTALKQLPIGKLNNLKIRFPKLPEQQRIADFLSSIDDLITAQSQKLDALRDHKKGLMQQLFPSVSEVQE